MSKIKIYSASMTDVGRKRHNNEDSLVYFEPDNPQEIIQSGSLYIVADGVGGAAKGERASEFAANSVLYEYYRRPTVPPGERLSQLMREAGNLIYQYADKESFGRMATTMVAVVIRDNKLLVAHVGDSRVYILRNKQIKQLTRDHSLVGEMIRDGTMTEEESMVSSVKNKITRSLGGEENVQVDVSEEYDLFPGDRILLCSDGLTRYALPTDLLTMVPTGSPAQAVQTLINFANSKGGADNVTAIVISVHDADEKITWGAAAHNSPTQPSIWDQETDPNAVTRYPRRSDRRTKSSPLVNRLIIASAMVVTVLSIFIISLFLFPPNKTSNANVTNVVVTNVTNSPTITPTQQTPLPPQLSVPLPTTVTTESVTPTPLTTRPDQNIYTSTSVPTTQEPMGECKITDFSPPNDMLSKIALTIDRAYETYKCEGKEFCLNGHINSPEYKLYAGMTIVIPDLEKSKCDKINGTFEPKQ
jgi:protein phosphatase